MLVLSRRRNETIVIDGNTRITVLDIRGNQVRLGIEAPEKIGILREELCSEIRAVEQKGGPASPASPLYRAVHPGP